ncbi:KptA family-domain-containing protein [Trametes meyenii]|nr:KptA family-domain-containing protein [Trametes meyenii]
MSANNNVDGNQSQASKEPNQENHSTVSGGSGNATDRGRGGRGQTREGAGGRGGSAKLRGLPKDSHAVRISKTLSWILRHGSQSEGLAIRPDGYVRVDELLQRPKLRELNFEALQEIVEDDAKGRYSLILEADPKTSSESWWIRANQGHSMKSVTLDYEPIKSVADIPTGIAIHGTTKRAWESIKFTYTGSLEDVGLSKMTRNHIHLAQGVPGSGVISGMRNSSQILIYVDVQKALDAGIRFYLSPNGVILTEGDERGFLIPHFFSRVETAGGRPLTGWGGRRSFIVPTTSPVNESVPHRVSVGVGPSKQEEAVQTSTEEIGVSTLAEKVQGTTL